MARNVKGPTDGRTTRWDDHRDQRRTEFVNAAVAAIDRHGPDAGIAEIATEAGVSKPVLYRYFADKAELHAEVGAWGARQVLDRVIPELLTGAPIRDKVEHAVDAYLATIAEHPQVFLLLVRHRADGADPLADGKQRIATTFARILGDTLRGLGVDSAGAEPWSHGLVGLGLSTGEWWLSRQTMSREAAARYLSAFVRHAFEGISEEYGVPLTELDAHRPPRADDQPTPITKGRRQ
ncbi:TetR/AcrR family transcriptional regulator [Nocardioides jensenii]|uniref:TetR/AcrR family transcriptional regulator n=1 Tax=Nocardioides jensenii TaxID=1843 RepID=UPI00082973B8|nr:TetR/AcrR family transcriptional regulator [Nocardioides jensenii]